jgi:hypothetical protein
MKRLPAMTRLRLLVAGLAIGVVIVGVTVAGCEMADEAAREAADSAAAKAAGCAATAHASPLPSAFPATVPLPPGAIVTGGEQRSGGRLIVTAIASGGFRSTLQFMQRAYPDAGLALSAGEVEDRDAESNFTGHGLQGRWTLREIPDCGGDSLVTVLVAPA